MEVMVDKKFGSRENRRTIKVRSSHPMGHHQAPVAGEARPRHVKQTKAEKRLHVRKLDYERNNLGGKVGQRGGAAYHRPGSLK